MEKEISELTNFCLKYRDLFLQELEGTRIQQDTQSILISSLWLRMVENFEGVVAVVNAKVPVNGLILMRSMSEAFILMKNIIKNKEFYKIYFNKFANTKIKRLSRVGKLKEKSGFTISVNEIEELKSIFSSQINSEAKNEYQISELFTEVDEVSLYELVYSHCNIFTHCDAASLDVYIKKEADNFTLVTNSRIIQDSVLVVFMSASIFLKGFEVFSNFLNHQPINGKSFVDNYNKFHDYFAQKLKDDD